MTYRLGLLSEIPVIERQGRYWSLDLWVKDLAAQARCVRSVTLFCPIHKDGDSKTALLPLPETIRVSSVESAAAKLAAEVAGVDIVQIPGNFTWRGSARARRFMGMAHRASKPVALAISSDRATTLLVNSRDRSLVHRLKARLGSLSIRVSQRYLAKRCEGALVVGEGLRRLVEPASRNVFVGTASWISSSDIQAASTMRRDPATVHLCIAARLEKMKGIGIGLDAFADLQARANLDTISLLIAGAGPEEYFLKAKALSMKLDGDVKFAGTFAYPEPFFELLRTQDIVVLTNLNDEQPRLVFDAVSQGCLIVCPDSIPYRALGIPGKLMYRRGDAKALADTMAETIKSIDDPEIREQLQSLAREATIETMHERRRDWVSDTLLSGSRRPALTRAT